MSCASSPAAKPPPSSTYSSTTPRHWYAGFRKRRWLQIWSSCANVGAMALSAAARRVELAARSGLLDRPAVMVALIIAEFARARFALIGYQAEMRAGTDAHR
jgi:sugar phosphate permease